MKPALAVLPVFFFCLYASANDWPGWRGPNADGKIPDASGYPKEWSLEKKLKWRVPLPAPGNSSPIVVGDKLFLTMAGDAGKIRSLQCRSTKDGELLWEKAVSYGNEDATHKTNPYCAASPVSDGEMVWAWFGNAGLYACDLNGKEIWNQNLGSDYVHQWGPNAASPVLYGDSIILHAGPGAEVRLISIDRKSGKVNWNKDLPDAKSKDLKEFKGSWATPLLIRNGNRDEMLIGLPGALKSFDPKTGNELWSCEGLKNLCYTNVLATPEMAIYLGGYGGPGMAVKLPDSGKTGDITESNRIWHTGDKRNRQRIGSGQIVGEHLYQLDEPGVMVCIEIASGTMLWEERLGRKSWSSLNLIGDLLYVNDQSGTTFVIKPDPSGIKILHQNTVDRNQHTNSSPAYADDTVYQRTDAFLYAFTSS